MDSLTESNWLIVGLGNPGERYEKTRHNLGFMLIDLLARQAQTQVKRTECRALIGHGEIENQAVELVKPRTFMNLSGEAVSCLLRKDNRSSEKLIVIVDDLAIPFGTIRIRSKGSDGGHNGLKSITACLKTQDYFRLRIGIKPEHPINDTSSFVLDNFSKGDQKTIEEVLDQSAKAVCTIISEGIEKAMANHN
jgi:peptidyl-tRNA hydrolase, PTH1 family